MDDKLVMKLFKRIEDINTKVDTLNESASTKDDIRHLESTIDGYAAKIDNYALEMAAMDHKINRLEKYIQILANKTGVDLDTISV